MEMTVNCTMEEYNHLPLEIQRCATMIKADGIIMKDRYGYAKEEEVRYAIDNAITTLEVYKQDRNHQHLVRLRKIVATLMNEEVQ